MSISKSLQTLTARAKREAERNRRRAERLLDRIERAKHRIAESFYEIGTALASLSEPRHYGALGYRSFTALVADRRILPRATVLSLIAVARSFPREQALALGPSKAFALARYVDATPADDVASLLVAADARIDGKPVSTLSVRDLNRAVTTVRAKRRGRTADERAARRAAREAQAGLRRRGVPGLRAEASHREGEWWLRIELPVDALEKVVGRIRR